MRASLWFLVVLFLAPSAVLAERQTPIYVWFSHHIDDGRDDVTSTRPIRSTAALKWLMQVYEKHGIKAQLGFVGSVLQLIHQDDPQVTAAIRRLKMPVGYHPGSGHREPCQVGRAVFVPSRGPQDREARRKNLGILWNFETKTLIPKWRWAPEGGIRDDNPQYGQLMPFEELSKYNLPHKESWRFGGWMAIQAVLDICPMDSLKHEAFVWRQKQSPETLDAAWNFVPE